MTREELKTFFKNLKNERKKAGRAHELRFILSRGISNTKKTIQGLLNSKAFANIVEYQAYEVIVWIGGLYDDMSKEDRDWRLYVKFNSPDDFYIEGETL